MARNLLSSRRVETAKPEGKEYLLADGDRLYLRVRENGEKDWFLIFTFEGKRDKYMLGKYPTLSLDEVRTKADKHRKFLQDGINPKEQDALEARKAEAEKQAQMLALEATSKRMTVNALFNLWHSLQLQDRKDGGKEVKRMFDKDVLPIIGNLAAEDVRKSHIVHITNALLERKVSRMAKVVLSLTRQMFRFAQDQDIIENEPTSSIRKAKIGGKDTVRDRVLSESEIKELLAKMPNANFLISTECALWIMLSTLCRIGELCKAKWSDIDLKEGVWVIPKENTKNAKPHKIYLSDFAINEFKRIPITSDTWVFPNQKGDNHVCEKSMSKQVGDRQLSEERIKNKGRLSGRSKNMDALKLTGGKFTPHDLRRTGATLMGSLNVRPDVIEKCLNHIEQNKITRTYQHQTLAKEQAEAWKLLGEHLNIIISTKNVVGIRSASSY